MSKPSGQFFQILWPSHNILTLILDNKFQITELNSFLVKIKKVEENLCICIVPSCQKLGIIFESVLKIEVVKRYQYVILK